MINIGLVLLQKDSKQLASLLDILFDKSKSDASLPPMGYPHKNPQSMTKAPYEETWNNLQTKGEIMRTRRSIADVFNNRFDRSRNGNNVGKIVLNHKSNPVHAPE